MTVAHESQLMVANFRAEAEHVAARERELEELLRPAEGLYPGLQHIRPMRRIRAVRDVADWRGADGLGLM
jgi:hypothetical protein